MTNPRIPALRKWLVLARPWALPASLTPVVWGTSLAAVMGGARIDFPLFALALAAMAILHTSANILSDIVDFRRGLDTAVTPGCGAIVRGWVTPRQAGIFSAILLIIGASLGFVLVLKCGFALLWIGVVGVVLGAAYAFLKPIALGDAVVFVNFGVLGTLGSWFVQTKALSIRPVLWSLPLAMLVSGILHANNWRDGKSDREKKVTTLAFLLGDRGSFLYYLTLIFGSMVLILFFVFAPRIVHTGIPALPSTMILVLVALPGALALSKKASKRHNSGNVEAFAALDAATAGYNLFFGLLCAAALWLHRALQALGIL